MIEVRVHNKKGKATTFGLVIPVVHIIQKQISENWSKKKGLDRSADGCFHAFATIGFKLSPGFFKPPHVLYMKSI